MMCGIAGVLSPTQQPVIELMTHALHHRGPDGVGYYQDGEIALGHRRLSIIDLDGGRQPISNETGTLQLICNGEIYNSPALRRDLLSRGHVFKTATDVEVVLHLYEEHGEACVRYLRGMFAFAIWDHLARKLFLARDHMGQKPLFFYQGPQSFLFASEVKAILASGLVQPDIDFEALWHYMSLRFIPDDQSLFKGIQKLPAATSLVLQNGELSLKRYWDMDFCHKRAGDERTLTAELDTRLQESVSLHLLSDVRVGTFLSGGIDSTTIAAMMAGVAEQPVPAFSIGVKEQGFNELPYARLVAEQHGLELQEQVVQANLIRLLPTMIHHMDEPADPYSAGIYLVSKLASQTVKVALTGDGADESFAGYDRYLGQKLVDYYCLLPSWLRRTVMPRLIERIPESFGYKSLAQKAAWLQQMSFFSHGERYAQSLSFLRFTHDSKSHLFTDTAKQMVHHSASLDKILVHFNADRVEHLVDQMLYSDLMTRIPDHNLVIGDRMSMAHSLELRAPFVDPEIVAFAATLPASVKLKGTQLKYLLRRVAVRYLPASLVKRSKQGFGFPLGLWMRTELRDFMQNLFADSRFIQLGVFNQGYITQLCKEHWQGQVDHNYRLWMLINLELWYRLYYEGETPESLHELVDRLAVSQGEV